MSENTLSEIGNWLKSVFKAGDLQGHEFHGNQYSQNASGSTTTPAPAPARQSDPNRYQAVGRWGQQSPAEGVEPTGPKYGQVDNGGKPTPPDNISDHVAMSKWHTDMQNFHAQHPLGVDSDMGGYHKDASDAHAIAANIHGNAARVSTPYKAPMSQVAQIATRLAQHATEKTGGEGGAGNIHNRDTHEIITNPYDFPRTPDHGPFSGGNKWHTTSDSKMENSQMYYNAQKSADLDINDFIAERFLKDANESLATVMRHDQDHDDWHRSHGDEPCTSEADCAAKRAKYTEVAKGDVTGHPFHGNQYSSAGALATRAASMFKIDAIGPERNTWGGNSTKDFENIVSGHRQLEADHRADAAAEYAKGNTKAGDLHTAAARAHADAAEAWQKSNEAGYTHAQRESGVPTSAWDAHIKSQDASRATSKAVGASNSGSLRTVSDEQASDALDRLKNGSDSVSAVDDHKTLAQYHAERGQTDASDAHEAAANEIARGTMNEAGQAELQDKAIRASEANGVRKLGDDGASENIQSETAIATRRSDIPYRTPLTASQPPEGIHSNGSPRYHGAFTLHVDGNVNPITGKSSSGSKQATTFSNRKSYAIVQGQRPGGSTFTRMVPCDRSWRIGDSMRFLDDGRPSKDKGLGHVVGITDPSNGAYYGQVPNRPLSHNSID